jgi:hypothetical protein
MGGLERYTLHIKAKPCVRRGPRASGYMIAELPKDETDEPLVSSVFYIKMCRIILQSKLILHKLQLR